MIDQLDDELGTVLALCEAEESTHIMLEDYMANALDTYDKILKFRFEIGSNFYEQPLC